MMTFCTYFDINYLSRGLALYSSLREHALPFRLHVLCMDTAAFDSLTTLALPEITPIALEDLERRQPALLAAKTNRSRIEYYFTCTAALPLYILDEWQDVDIITYLDADLFFFESPAALFDELGAGSVGIVAHRFPEALKDREQYGIYNVGWVSFRRDKTGIECLTWWRDQCIEWCYDRVEEGRFADQKYLDQWPSRFDNVVVLQHPGANLAPWNIDNHVIDEKNGQVTVDSRPLIFFHFHGLKQVGRWVYEPGWKEYAVEPNTILRTKVYLPYIRALRSVTRALASHAFLPTGVRIAPAGTAVAGNLRRFKHWLTEMRRKSDEIAHGELILCFTREDTISMKLSA
jgi:hypothetical protein